jgi:hypothetical protein
MVLSLPKAASFDGNAESIASFLERAPLPSGIVLRRVFDNFHNQVKIVVAGFVRGGERYIFERREPITPEFPCDRAAERLLAREQEAA